MTRALSGVSKQVRTLMAIVLLTSWPAVVGAEEIGGTALYLHPDAYWYNNENHASASLQAPTAPVVKAPRQAAETWDTALVLHPDAYWYNNENHTPTTPAASTPSVELASRPR